MSRAAECRSKAEDCETSAATVADPALRALHLDLARQWWGMAQLAEGVKDEPVIGFTPLRGNTKSRDDLT
jgi:hypothetical protein